MNLEINKPWEIFDNPKAVSVIALSSFIVAYFSDNELMGFAHHQQIILPIACIICIITTTASLLYALRRRMIKKEYIEYLKDLTAKEQYILCQYILEKTQTTPQRYNNGIVNGLVAKNILYRASNLLLANRIFDYTHGCDYNIQPWAWKYLKSHPSLLAEGKKEYRAEFNRKNFDVGYPDFR